MHSSPSPIVSLKKEMIYGWQGYRLSAGDVTLGLIPQLGGRIISLTHQGEELLFVQDAHQGEIFFPQDWTDLRVAKREMGFRLWGGDKTWVAPQAAWWEGIPPLELDAGPYVAEVKANCVIMTSKPCRETGVQVIRAVELKSDGRINLEQTFRNVCDQAIAWGIWDVTQVLRPFTVYLPASRASIRAYQDEGLIEDAQRNIKEEGGRCKISCDDATHFKFGGIVEQGNIVAVRQINGETLAYDRTFEIDPNGRYAHNAMVEVYNSPVYNYLEIEVHAPLVRLAPGEETTHQQTWRMTRHKSGLPLEGLS